MGFAAMTTIPTPDLFVDEAGVLRWRDSGDEAAFFGVNYVAPFAYTRRALGYVGADPRATIDDDVRHLARLGCDALRLHLWEVEIADRDGNLLDNEHRRLLDHLIAACRRHGLWLMLTAFRWGENGYPEADTPTDAFSARFPRSQMGRHPDAVAASARFVGQLARAYKDEPALALIELVNEPWSPPADRLIAYVETLADAVRATGCRKPLLYNASQGAYPEQTAALGKTRIEGVTFGWYPTGLVSGRTLEVNPLPLVARYPLMDDSAYARKLKAVYEFDGADLDFPAVYPACARTFRRHGVQWATQFAYCPLPLAAANTPYPTHHLNLVYAPRQALGLAVAAEAFRRLPRGKGDAPELLLGYRPDACVWRGETVFLHAGDTDAVPPRPERLERVAGVGRSPVVDYEGSGAYFLDRLAPGVWRLEVYPDAVRVDDPHGAPRLDRDAIRLVWKTWPMALRLPDLGTVFAVEPCDPGNAHRARAKDARFPIRPGVYRLRRSGAAAVAAPDPVLRAPRPAPQPPRLAHRPDAEAVEGKPLRIVATVASESPNPRVALHLADGRTLRMRRERGLRYEVEVPARAGRLAYTIAVDGGERFPGGPETVVFVGPVTVEGAQTLTPPPIPRDAARGEALWVRARAVKGTATLTLRLADRAIATVPLTATTTTRRIPLADLRPNSGWVLLHHPLASPLTSLSVSADAPVVLEKVSFGPARDTWVVDVRPRGAPIRWLDPTRDVAHGVGAGRLDGDALVLDRKGAWRCALGERWESRRADFAAGRALRLDARALGNPTQVQVAVIDRDGAAWAASVEVGMTRGRYVIPRDALSPTNLAPVPVAYPTLPPVYQPPPPTPRGPLDFARADAFQIGGAAVAVYGLEL